MNKFDLIIGDDDIPVMKKLFFLDDVKSGVINVDQDDCIYFRWQGNYITDINFVKGENCSFVWVRGTGQNPKPVNKQVALYVLIQIEQFGAIIDAADRFLSFSNARLLWTIDGYDLRLDFDNELPIKDIVDMAGLQNNDWRMIRSFPSLLNVMQEDQ